MANKPIHVLTSGVVVDNSVLKSLSADEVLEVFTEANKALLPVVVVENASTFFTAMELVKRLEAGTTGWQLICEHLGVEVTASEATAIQQAVNIRNAVVDRVKAIKKQYQFAAVPDWFDVANDIQVNGARVWRRSNNSYTIGLKTLRSIWGAASKLWFENSRGTHDLASINASGYSYRPRVFDNRIDIGCKVIFRYEIEQFAFHQGWAFPE